jgi:uncharacterized membrane protein
MNNLSFLKLYGITLTILAIIDIPWILLIANSFYKKQIGHLMTSNPQYWPAVLFYTSYAAALIVFALLPGLEKQSLLYGCKLAFFLGFICYGAYDLTNQATLKNWPLIMTIVDMLWGASMSTIVTFLTMFITLK